MVGAKDRRAGKRCAERAYGFVLLAQLPGQTLLNVANGMLFVVKPMKVGDQQGRIACGEGQGGAQHGIVCRFARLRHGEHGRLLQKERRAVRLNEPTAGAMHQ